MSISTAQLYDRSASLMARLTARADQLQTQVATNKRLSAPSDDVVAYRQLAGIRRATADDAAYGANLRTAQSLLQQSDSALSSVETELQSASELVVQANSGTLNSANRQTIGAQLNSILDALVGIANQNDLRGQPLFGAASGNAAVTRAADGSVAFAGVGEPAAIPIGDGQNVQAGDSAARVFGGVRLKSGATSDTFAILKKIADALTSGSDPAALKTASDDLSSALDQVTAVHGAVGARANRVDLLATQQATVATDREASRSALEDTDITATITELQKTMTVLQATQASFTKLSQLSLFDYLR